MLQRCLARLIAFLRRDDGLTSTGYAVVVAIVIVICLAAVVLMGKSSRKVFSVTSQGMTTEKPRDD